MTYDHKYEERGQDNFEDDYRVAVTHSGYIELELTDSSFPAKQVAAHSYTPEQVRLLRKHLKKAIRIAEEVRNIG